MSSGIQINHLTTTYQGRLALDDITTTLPRGQIIGIVGPNGAGKSTLIKSILDIKAHSGKATFTGKSIKAIQKKVAYVEQRSSLDLDFPINVFETVLMGTYPTIGLFKHPKAQERDRALKALDTVGMSSYATHQIGELSGGQLQRVFIARVLAQEAEWIFLDEPFIGIDMVSEQIIVDLLKTLRDQGKTIVIVHHDLSKVTHYFDSLIILKTALIAAGPVDKVFNQATLKIAYGTDFAHIRA
ncbi:MAG: metal ABC transporter ATP-binding protein [Aerococcus sp.]|nr:metal ABC transporter ATP-binding protein [Aerococcus sp.]